MTRLSLLQRRMLEDVLDDALELDPENRKAVRALGSLIQRGLVERRPRGFVATKEGRAAIRRPVEHVCSYCTEGYASRDEVEACERTHTPELVKQEAGCPKCKGECKCPKW